MSGVGREEEGPWGISGQKGKGEAKVWKGNGRDEFGMNFEFWMNFEI